METQKTIIPLPPKNYRRTIAQAVGCSEKTVTIALRTNTQGYKCDKVRETYYNLYVKPFLKRYKVKPNQTNKSEL